MVCMCDENVSDNVVEFVRACICSVYEMLVCARVLLSVAGE